MLVQQSMPSKLTTDDDPAHTSAGFVLSGVLVDEGGAPVPGVPLAFALDPSPEMQIAAEQGKDAIGFELASATTDGDGRFAAPIPALKDTSQYADENGANRLWVSGSGTNHAISHRFELIFPKDEGQRPRTTYKDEHTVTAGRARSAAEERPEVLSVKVPAHPAKALPVALRPGDNPHTACVMSWPKREYTQQYKWKQMGGGVKSMVNIQTLWTKGKSKAKFEWSNTKETRVSVGVDAAYRDAKFKASREKAAKTSSGVNFSIDAKKKLEAQVQYEFREYRVYCHYRSEGWDLAFYTEVKPYMFTGGNKKGKSSARFGCAKSVPLENELWVSRETSHTGSLSVSLFGALDSSQINTKIHKKTYTAIKPTTLCGVKEYPVIEDRVREK
ncbi:hypothetical protein GCM10010123_09260 [Pilimelia anulata]|uniref:Uncharacterized protein n=1 Tax=Pilimelia anulata TaxID=53371 RepID=A0A8J3B1A2_9ACTN|nr:hypothetical protein [Pilimelia anulata]GGJ81616.1 hypothetical protein GCM10010123_09260 [Pilimelia anulata]